MILKTSAVHHSSSQRQFINLLHRVSQRDHRDSRRICKFEKEKINKTSEVSKDCFVLRNNKMIEIERKFLVTSNDFKKEAITQNRIAQGYLSSVPERTVRVRIKGNIGFLTIKGVTNESGMSRFEWEKEIPVEEASELLKLCEEGIIDKTRFEVKLGNHVFEIDEFYGENKGLIIAEIELNSEKETFEKPIWLGEEVTQDIRYYNSYLSKNPYTKW
jgi:adenylate cyclase